MATIVVLEDNEDLAEMYELCLSARGHRVFVANTFNQAHFILDTQRTDLFLTDFTLREGLVTQFIHQRNGRVPAVTIVITGWQIIDVMRTFDMHPNLPKPVTYLQKPIECVTMCNTVSAHLERRLIR